MRSGREFKTGWREGNVIYIIRIEDRGIGRVMREEKLDPGTINAIYRRKCHNEVHYIVC